MDISTLGTRLHLRQGSNSGSFSIMERRSVDFLVDGESLLQILVKADSGSDDFMGCLVEGYPEQNKRHVEKLLLLAEPDTDSGRVLLYICPECGDIGCGAYSGRITKTHEHYSLSDFAYENGYEDARLIEGIGPFIFEESDYEKTIRSAAAF